MITLNTTSTLEQDIYEALSSGLEISFHKRSMGVGIKVSKFNTNGNSMWAERLVNWKQFPDELKHNLRSASRELINYIAKMELEDYTSQKKAREENEKQL